MTVFEYACVLVENYVSLNRIYFWARDLKHKYVNQCNCFVRNFI
jgi:hypothetical protein